MNWMNEFHPLLDYQGWILEKMIFRNLSQCLLVFVQVLAARAVCHSIVVAAQVGWYRPLLQPPKRSPPREWSLSSPRKSPCSHMECRVETLFRMLHAQVIAPIHSINNMMNATRFQTRCYCLTWLGLGLCCVFLCLSFNILPMIYSPCLFAVLGNTGITIDGSLMLFAKIQ